MIDYNATFPGLISLRFFVLSMNGQCPPLNSTAIMSKFFATLNLPEFPPLLNNMSFVQEAIEDGMLLMIPICEEGGGATLNTMLLLIAEFLLSKSAFKRRS